ncbi:MAG: polymer-forming cytoskeletal protein, partial [Desulfobacterales bacterium]
GNTGIVEADLEAKNIVIQGEVSGNVIAHKQLEIHPSGKLIGDCTAASIDIKEGAIFEGRSNMLKSAGLSAGTSTAPKVSAPQSSKQHQP